MKTQSFVKQITAAILLSGLAAANVGAVQILCSNDTSKNHMSIGSGTVDACLASGVGNIQGTLPNDPFLGGVGSEYTFAGKIDGAGAGGTGTANIFNIIYSQGAPDANKSSTGTFAFDADFWNTWSAGAIAFKFGTGNEPDEWFVYSLDSNVSSGSWSFNNVLGKGGGLSHVNLYALNRVSVPEPGTLALLGLGLAAMGLKRRLS